VIALLGLIPGWVSAQQSDVSFEVASLKPSGPVSRMEVAMAQLLSQGKTGFIPGDAGRVEIRGWSATELVACAYRVSVRQIVAPPWASDARYNIDATIPSGESPDRAPDMLRRLLQERLGLKAHGEVRKMAGYAISTAKDGPKLEDTGPAAPNSDPRSSRKKMRPGFVGLQLDHSTMAQVTASLERELNAPVEDQTGLKGRYSIVLEIPAAQAKDELARPGLYREALATYGIRLSAAKIDLPVTVIDNLTKTPTEN
jgi:uncharacterized protein (TIGR03435 family)